MSPLLLLIISLVFILGFERCSSSAPLAPALYVFGDSLVDSGTNNWLPTISRADYSPYGIDFLDGRPTGRATNGKTIADHFCDYLGLPYVPPYVGLPKRPNWRTGYNYASGACGILPETKIGYCHSLDTQVSNFQATVENELVSTFPTSNELSQHLSNSLFLLMIGGNDYLVNYFSESYNSSKIYTPEEFSELLINKLATKLQILYNLGARKIIVFEIVPFGCSPLYRNVSDPSGTTCDESKNKIAMMFNNNLAEMLQNLTSTYQDSHFTPAHIYDLTYEAYLNPDKYGIINSMDPCCQINDDGSCKWSLPMRPVPPCPVRGEYYFWDGSHPTEAIYLVQAKACINGSSTCLPLNIEQLVQVNTNITVPLHSAS